MSYQGQWRIKPGLYLYLTASLYVKRAFSAKVIKYINSFVFYNTIGFFWKIYSSVVNCYGMGAQVKYHFKYEKVKDFNNTELDECTDMASHHHCVYHRSIVYG